MYDSQAINEEFKKSGKMFFAKENINTSCSYYHNYGTGPYGTTFVAEDMCFEKPKRVVIKEISEKFLSNSTGQQNLTMYQRLVLMLPNLRINTLPIIRHYSSSAPYCIAFDYGNQSFTSLHSILSSKSTSNSLTSTQKLIIAISVANTMKCIHEYDQIHGDLNSYNILIPDDNLSFSFPMISDTQLAYSIDPTLSHARPNWQAPEIFKSHLDFSSDVYSYGCVLYEIVEGHPPFDGLNRQQIKDAYNSGRNPQITQKISKDLNQLIKRCLKPQGKDRPSFASIFKDLTENPTKFFPNINNDEIMRAILSIQSSEKMKIRLVFKQKLESPNFTIEDIIHHLQLSFSSNESSERSFHLFRIIGYLFPNYSNPQKLIQLIYALLKEQQIHPQNNENYAKNLINSQFIEFLFQDKSYIFQAFNMAFIVAKLSPQSYTTSLGKKLIQHIDEHPKKVITIMTLIVVKFDELSDPYSIFDKLLSSWRSLMNHNSILVTYINIFYFLCKISPDYHRARLYNCISCFTKFLTSKFTSVINAAYSFISFDYTDKNSLADQKKTMNIDIELDPDLISKHLQDNRTREAAFDYLFVKFYHNVLEKGYSDIAEITQPVAYELLRLSSRKAVYLLCGLIEINKLQTVVSIDEILSFKGSPKDKMRILLSLMLNEDDRQIIESSKTTWKWIFDYTKYSIVAKHGILSNFTLNVLKTLIISFGLTPNVIASSGEVFKLMLNSCIRNEDNLKEVFDILINVAKKDYNDAFPDATVIACKNIMKGGPISASCLDLLTLLSSYQICVEKMKEENLYDMLQDINLTSKKDISKRKIIQNNIRSNDTDSDF